MYHSLISSARIVVVAADMEPTYCTAKPSPMHSRPNMGSVGSIIPIKLCFSHIDSRGTNPTAKQSRRNRKGPHFVQVYIACELV